MILVCKVLSYHDNMKFCTLVGSNESVIGELIFAEIKYAFDMNIHWKGWSRVLFQKQIEYGFQPGYMTQDTNLANDADE